VKNWLRARSVRHQSVLSPLVIVIALKCVLLAQTAADGSRDGLKPGEAPDVVTYSLSLRDNDEHVLHVAIGISGCGDAQSACDMQLPAWNALYQVRDFAQYVRNVAARGQKDGNNLTVRARDKTTWSIAAAGQPFFFVYDIFVDSPGPFGAQLNNAHAFLNLAELLMYPVALRHYRPLVRLTDVPAGWRIGTAMQHFQDNTFVAFSYDAMVDSPVEIGTFSETSFDVKGAPIRVIVDADPSDYDLKAVAALARKIAETEIEWMHDRPIDHYVFIYHFPRHPTGGGMEHAYSTAINAPVERVKADPLSLADVTAHEFFHLWNVKRIRPQSLEPVDYTKEQYTRALWFSEGVTSTVADFIRVRAGYLDERGFLTEIANDIRNLESRPARLTQSVEESSLDAWLEKYQSYDSPQRSISYYNKGEIVGLLLDLQLREASGGKKSLRDLFHWMNEHYAKQGKFFPDSRGVQEAAEAVTGADFSDFFARYIAGVDPLPYEKLFSTVGLHLEKQAVTVPDPGFRTLRRQSEAGVIVAVTPGSEAERAGLRVGDVVQQVNGRAASGVPESDVTMLHIGDTVELRVLTAGGTRKIKFKLAGTTVDNYTLVERNDAIPAQRARRAAWMRGESE